MNYDNFSLRHIARQLDRSSSTIAGNINRSQTCQNYQAHAAHRLALSVTLVRHLPNRKAAFVSTAISQILRPYKAQFWTLTFYNGKEFAEHVFFDNCLQPEVVFAHPYNLWKRAPTRTRTGWCQFFFKGRELYQFERH